MDRAKHNVEQPGSTLPLSLTSPFNPFLPSLFSLSLSPIFSILFFFPLLPVPHLPLPGFSHGESTEKEIGLVSDAKSILSRDGEGQTKGTGGKWAWEGPCEENPSPYINHDVCVSAESSGPQAVCCKSYSRAESWAESTQGC